jgi:hypothetical protein
MADTKNRYIILVRNPEGKSPLRILGNRWWENFVKNQEDMSDED